MEQRKPYGVTDEVSDTALKPFSEWKVPTTREIRAAMKLADLTGSQLASLVGIKNSRTVRRWTGGEVEIPYAVWAILCYKAGLGVIWENNDA